MKNKHKEEKIAWEIQVINKVGEFIDMAYPREKKKAMSFFLRKHKKEITDEKTAKYAAVLFLS